ncbi:MAG: putative ABC transport system permease protein [Myxococcota bacterium]|jgi:putative ABC transport system permease protein
MDLDIWRELAHTLGQNRLRTGLTAAGVFWGMFMLLLMLGFGDGLQAAVAGKMRGGVTNSVFTWGQRTSQPFAGYQPGRPIQFDSGDIEPMRALPGVQAVSPRSQLGGYRDGNVVTHGTKSSNLQVMGDDPFFAQVQPMRMLGGRWINPLDVDERRKVAVIGKLVVDELYARGEEPLGSSVSVNGVHFTVVGVFAARANSDRADRQESTVHIPFTTFQQAFNQGDRIGWFAIVGAPEADGEALEGDIRALLARRHQFSPDDRMAVGAWNSAREFGRIQNLFAGIRAFVWFVGTATLLSGVVGVSNILLITVRERTPEIGLRRAIGATPASVVGLVLLEAVVLAGVAGYAGLVAGVAALEVVGWVVGESNAVLGNPQVDLGVALSALAILAVSSLFGGLLPAQRAAAIQPVEALRAE